MSGVFPEHHWRQVCRLFFCPWVILTSSPSSQCFIQKCCLHLKLVTNLDNVLTFVGFRTFVGFPRWYSRLLPVATCGDIATNCSSSCSWWGYSCPVFYTELFQTEFSSSSFGVTFGFHIAQSIVQMSTENGKYIKVQTRRDVGSCLLWVGLGDFNRGSLGGHRDTPDTDNTVRKCLQWTQSTRVLYTLDTFKHTVWSTVSKCASAIQCGKV